MIVDHEMNSFLFPWIIFGLDVSSYFLFIIYECPVQR